MTTQSQTQLHARPLFAFQADVAKPSIIGMTPGHDRRVGVITGGSFEGERLRGKMLSGGSDWQSYAAMERSPSTFAVSWKPMTDI